MVIIGLKGAKKMSDRHDIKYVDGHYEAYDRYSGDFIVSGDTFEECFDELFKMLVEDAKREISLESKREAVA